MEKYKSRKDVPTKYKWDLTDLFEDEKEFNDVYKDTLKEVNTLSKYKGMINDADKLYEFLERNNSIGAVVIRLYIYAYLINDQELGISKNTNRKHKSEELVNIYNINTAFFAPELLKLDKKEYQKLFTKNKKLNEYKALLDDIYRDKDHVLNEKEEMIITELNNAVNHFDDFSANMINREHDYGTITIDGKEEVITHTNLRKFLKNKDRRIRKEVREKFYKVIDNYSVSSADFLNGYVKTNLTNSKLHNFKNAWEEKLFDLEMDEKAYDALVNNTLNNTVLLRKYFRLFKETLKLDKLYPYDLNLELANSNKKYEIEEAQELCLKAIEPLGKDYIEAFRKIFTNRYIDYAEYKGKQSGGYSFAPTDRDSKILMSYNYDLSSVSTIIHEGGHNVHHQFVSKNNPYHYRDVSNLVAEVASLTNECLLSSYLAENGTKEEKLAGIANIIEVFISNMYGAVREGSIEREFYKYVEDGNSLNKDYLNDLVIKSLEKYYGKEVILDDYSALSWTTRSHYYMNYYLYNYAFCIAVASSIASDILAGKKEVLDKYLKFLSLGSDTKPLEAFKVLGTDLTKDETYIKAFNYFDSMLDKFEKISKEGEGSGQN